ncbi:MAG: MFS transporter [Chloroflexi bacterium]|nr:MFS transporter [Chloroflexota bacterium]
MAVAYSPLRSFSELPTRTRNFVVLGLMLGLLLGALDQTIVGTAMPRIIADLGGLDRYSWVVTAYLITSTISVPIVGKLGDQFGRKWFYVVGIFIFLSGSALSGASGEVSSLPLIGDGMNQLVLFRGLQGIGAGIMQANSFAIVGDLFPPARRGQVQGLFGAVFGIASVIGPTLGGYITDNLNWRWVFYINLPVGAIALAVLISTMPVIRAHHGDQKIDYLGAATITAALVPLLLGFTWAGGQYSWTSAQVLVAFGLAAVMAVTFCIVELKAVAPILPLDLFKDRTFTVSSLAVFATGFGMFGTILYIPLFIQGVIGSTPMESGQVLTPMMIGVIIASVLGGQIIQRTERYRILGILGPLVMAFGLFLLSRQDVNTTNAETIRNMIFVGLGLGITFPVFTIAVQNAAPLNRLGVVTSGVQFFRSIGGTIGTAIMGSFLNSQLSAQLKMNVPVQIQQAMAKSSLGSQSINAQALVSPQAKDAIQAAFDKLPGGAQLFALFDHALRMSLANAIAHVFGIGLFIVLASTLVAIFLPELPLRRSNSVQPSAQIQGAASSQRTAGVLGVAFAIISREAQRPDADPTLLYQLSALANGELPREWSDEERGRAVAAEIVEPLAVSLLATYASGGDQPGTPPDAVEPSVEPAMVL